MTDNRPYKHCLIFASILIVGLGLAFALPWLANSQGLAAQSEVREQDNTPEATRYYVAKTGTGLNPTVDWSGAYTNVQDALVVAVEPSEIWVAKGVYYPDVGSGQINDSVTATFLMTDGVSIFGGFTFGDSDINDRDWENNLTVLSGDVDGDDTSGTDGVVLTTTDIVDFNAYHVVTAIGVSSTAKLDGFTITAGQAGGTGYPNNIGGGFYCDGFGGGKKCSPSLKNVIFSGNSADEVGGAMFNNGEEDGDSSPSLTNVTFSGNSAVYNGVAMYNDGYNGNSNPSLTNVTFSGNSAGYEGGAMYNDGNDTGNSSPSLTNVAFSGNSAVYNGGAMFNDGSYGGTSSPTLTNVTFSGNSAGEEGGAMYNRGKNNGTCSPQVRNSIVWNNQADGVTGTITATIYNLTATITLSYSLVEDSGGSGSWALDPTSYVNGGGNIDEDPLFIEPISPSTAPTTTGSLRLCTGSPAIDAGDNTFAAGVLTDLDGEARIKDGDADGVATIDMGAYEAKGFYQLTVAKAGSGYGQVTSTPTGINCGNTCSEFFLEDSSITLIATPDGNSTFTDWGGVCSGTGDCVVTMDGAKNVTANFETNPLLSVYLAGSGAGTVTSTPKGIACGTDCNQIYPYGTQVKLLADAGPYSVFKGWSGACNGSGDCSVTMDGAKNVTAQFETKRVATTLYLPILLDIESTVLKGRVTDKGAPVQVKVELRYFDGSNWSTYRTANTNSNGEYLFGSLPILSGNQSYYVRFVNVYNNESWLTAWGCWEITPTTTDPSLSRCDFDIENIFQISPNPGATVTLPQDFTWTTRITTSDSYIFSIADISDYDPHARTDPLGYVGGVNITGLPPGFVSGKEYGWWLEIISSEGLGFSYYYFDVTFQQNCDPSYPTVCIPPPPPDLDCSDIPYKNFKVLPPDPHNFDGDGDGIGCETYRSNLDSSNPTYYLTPQSQDLDYVDIPYKFYRDITPGPQPFDGDGIGCESWP